jgi:hypothetical protein
LWRRVLHAAEASYRTAYRSSRQSERDARESLSQSLFGTLAAGTLVVVRWAKLYGQTFESLKCCPAIDSKLRVGELSQAA